MAWIESHQALLTHPKVHDLMALMGWDLDTTIAKLHRFWWWCVDYAENGDLRKHSIDRLGRAVGLVDSSTAHRFVESMISTGWIDEKPYFRVHDWWEYIGLFLQRRYGNKNSEKWRAVQQLYSSCTEVVHQLAQPTNQPNQPNLPTNQERNNMADAVEELLGLWNSKNSLPKIAVLSDTRREKLKARLKSSFFVENWRAAIDKLVKSPFCTGSNDRGWKADIDWFLSNDSVVAKIIEGKYDPKKADAKSMVDAALEREGIYEK
jgi:hypothetical protein